MKDESVDQEIKDWGELATMMPRSQASTKLEPEDNYIIWSSQWLSSNHE